MHRRPKSSLFHDEALATLLLMNARSDNEVTRICTASRRLGQDRCANRPPARHSRPAIHSTTRLEEA